MWCLIITCFYSFPDDSVNRRPPMVQQKEAETASDPCSHPPHFHIHLLSFDGKKNLIKLWVRQISSSDISFTIFLPTPQKHQFMNVFFVAYRHFKYVSVNPVWCGNTPSRSITNCDKSLRRSAGVFSDHWEAQQWVHIQRRSAQGLMNVTCFSEMSRCFRRPPVSAYRRARCHSWWIPRLHCK